MREQPFIDAVDNLRRAQELSNLQMIMDMQRNKAKLQGQVPNLTPQTNLHKQLMTQAQDIYTISEDKVMN